MPRRKTDTSSRQLYIGTSGWSYDHWKGPFYAPQIHSDYMLDDYAKHFNSVEINNSFYHLPQINTLKHWYDTVPDRFVFSVKASRYITHMKKLKDPEKSMAKFVEHVTILKEKLGPILFQLPPHWQFNHQRLEEFLRSLSREFRYTFEFRDRSWINDETYEILNRFNAAFCIYDLEGYFSPENITTDFVYIRLHGPDGAYRGSYSPRFLEKWATVISTWAEKGLSVYCYFDNDEAGYAAQNSLRLQSILKEQAQIKKN